MGVRITGDLGRLERKLKALQNRAALQRAGRRVGEALVSSTIRRFNEQRDPKGRRWQPLSRATVEGSFRAKDFSKRGRLKVRAARRTAGRLILIQSARLRNSIAWHQSGMKIHVGTNVKYARIHQMGGEAGRKTGRVTIPQREFLGISPDDKVEIAHAVRDAVSEGLL